MFKLSHYQGIGAKSIKLIEHILRCLEEVPGDEMKFDKTDDERPMKKMKRCDDTCEEKDNSIVNCGKKNDPEVVAK